MFWEKNYTPSQNIEVLLEKEGVTVEEFLDEDDIIQECKSQRKTLLTYFTRPDVLRRLVELITTIPSEDLPMAQRFRHANVACEILTLGLPSLDEKLLADAETLQLLYSYLTNQPPLNPLLSSFFSKTFRTLFTKKTDQDWFLYQQMCLKLLEYLKLQNNFVDLICKHFNTPVIPDLILQMMRNVEGGQLRRNLYNWLNEERLIEKVINVLADVNECEKHANVSEFLCDLIQQGRTMRQTEQENDSFEPVFEGSNPILQNIESAATLEALFNVILQPNALETTIVSGITVVLKIIKPIVILDERNPDRLKFIQDREKEIHDKLLNTVISVIQPHLKHFNELLSNPPKTQDIVTTAAKLSPPFGTTRLQICRLFTVLLQTNNEDISKAICETDFFETLLNLFKQYCWNNFLHSEVEKCLQTVFYTTLAASNNNSNISTYVSNGSQSKHSTMSDNVFDNTSDNIFNIEEQQQHDDEEQLTTVVTTITNLNITNQSNKANDIPEKKLREKISEGDKVNEENKTISTEPFNENNLTTEANITDSRSYNNCDDDSNNPNMMQNVTCKDEVKVKSITIGDINTCAQQNINITLYDPSIKIRNNLDNISAPKNMESKEIVNIIGDNKEQDITKAADMGPSKLQTHVIVNCKIVGKLVDCWQHNKEAEEGIKGRRLGYMGHLIQIFRHINNCISESEQIGALIENNFQTDTERELWQSIVNTETGDLTKALKLQNQLLANCNAHEACDYNISLDFLTDTDLPDAFSNLCVDEEFIRNNFNLLHIGGASNSNMDDDGDDNIDDSDFISSNCNDGSLSIYGKTSMLSPFSVTNNPWEMNDDFNVLKTTTTTTVKSKPNNTIATTWTSNFGTDNFADFDTHFSSFSSDLGSTYTTTTISNNTHTASMCLSDINYSNSSNTDYIGGTNSNEETFNYMLNTEEYNKNVDLSAEKLSSWQTQFTVPILNKSSTLVGCHFTDVYENDEGMWTKPLGNSNAVDATATANETLKGIKKNEEICENTNIASPKENGPIFVHDYSTTIINAESVKSDKLENNNCVNESEDQNVNDESKSNCVNELLNNLAEVESTTMTKIVTSDPIFSNSNDNDLNEIITDEKSAIHQADVIVGNEHKFTNKNLPIETIATTSGNAVENVQSDMITTTSTA